MRIFPTMADTIPMRLDHPLGSSPFPSPTKIIRPFASSGVSEEEIGRYMVVEIAPEGVEVLRLPHVVQVYQERIQEL
jgi:hypothetical protein